jgi:hypothetical protein
MQEASEEQYWGFSRAFHDIQWKLNEAKGSWDFLVVSVTRRVQRVGIILESKYSSTRNREQVTVLIQNNTGERSG